MSEDRHPFQRKQNTKATVVTPFQRSLVQAMAARGEHGVEMSGRNLSSLLGKSANHVSQILNDGFVPSGPAILDMARVLELDGPGTDALIRAAMETKAVQRSRDNFWIKETSRMLRLAEDDIGVYVEFIRDQGLEGAFATFSTKKKTRLRSAGGDESKPGKSRATKKRPSRPKKAP